jgi:hypothetical protein
LNLMTHIDPVPSKTDVHLTSTIGKATV